MGKPSGEIFIKALNTQKIKQIKLLGSNEAIKWKQTADALVIKNPNKIPSDIAAVFKIILE